MRPQPETEDNRFAMALRITDTEFKLLRNLIENECGIMLDDGKAYLVENRLCHILKRYNCKSYGEFYFKLKNGPSHRELTDQVVDAIATNETSWFRDERPFRALADRVLPELYDKAIKKRIGKIRICSAGCSTGQEPYSIAMEALDFFGSRGGAEACREMVEVVGVDISRQSLKTAKAGTYGAHSMKRGMGGDRLKRYFSKKENLWVVRPPVRDLVSFYRFNMRYPMTGFGFFQVVFLRNVIIYFSDDFKRSILEKATRVLASGGYLFMGTGETPGACAARYETVEYEGAVFYRKTSKNSC